MPLSQLFFILTVVSSVSVLVFMLYCGRKKTTASPNTPPPDLTEMKKFILWRAFYVNPHDPRGWVPKTYGYGWTVNFRTKTNAFIFAILIICTLTFALLLTFNAI